MSISVPDTSSIAGVASSIGGLTPGDIPAAVRNGNSQAKQAYSEGLAFEQVLVNQLVQSMSSDISDFGATDGTDGSDGSLNQTGLLAGDNSSSNVYSGLMTQALSSSIMGSGGLGIAAELAQDLDPAIGTPAGAGTAGNFSGGATVAGNGPDGGNGSAVSDHGVTSG